MFWRSPRLSPFLLRFWLKTESLRLADHSYLFLPIKDQMELKINGSDNGDISSTRLANEILVDLYGIKNLKNKEGTL